MKQENVFKLAIIIVIVAITAGVVGFKFAKNVQAPVEKMASVQPIVQTKPATADLSNKLSDDTTRWQTYTDAKNGFEFKYPADWEVKEDTRELGIPGERFFIKPKKPNELNRKLEFELEVPSSQNGIETMKNRFESTSESKKITVNGYQAYYLKHDNQYSTKLEQYLILNGGVALTFNFIWEMYQNTGSASSSLDYSYQQEITIFTTVVNSIKFLN